MINKSISPQPQATVKHDLMTFVGLMTVTLLIAFVNYRQARPVVTFPLLLIEAGLIGLYFKHLIAGKRTILFVLLLTLTLAVSLALWTGWDWIYSMRNVPVFE